MPVLKLCGSIIIYIAGMMSDDRLQIDCLCILMNIDTVTSYWSQNWEALTVNIFIPHPDTVQMCWTTIPIGLANLLYYCYMKKQKYGIVLDCQYPVCYSAGLGAGKATINYGSILVTIN